MNEDVRAIDLATWRRRKHFELFQGMAYPYFSLCVEVDVEALVRAVAGKRASFTSHLVYVLTRTANSIPEFRQRIRGDRVVEHRVVHPPITLLSEDDLFSFCLLEYVEKASAFVQAADAAFDRARRHPSIEDEPGRDGCLFMTTIPWISFTSMTHPVPLSPPDSIPRIAWGRYRAQTDRLAMPLSVQAHHALMDGIHVARFFERVQGLINEVERWSAGIE